MAQVIVIEEDRRNVDRKYFPFNLVGGGRKEFKTQIVTKIRSLNRAIMI